MPKSPERCSSCGDDTAVGSPLYSDRRVFKSPTGQQAYLCSSCAERAVDARRRPAMTDAERVDLERGAALFGAFAPGGH